MGIGNCTYQLLKPVNHAMVYPAHPWFPVTPLVGPHEQSIKGLLFNESKSFFLFLVLTTQPQVENRGAFEQGREHAGYHIKGS